MPSSVRSVFAAAGLETGGSVLWGTPVPPNPAGPTTGVYAVALTSDAHDLSNARPMCPISDGALRELLDARPELLLDAQRPDIDALRKRLSAFWLPDEVMVYIGLAGPRRSMPREGELAKRLTEYYKTPLGARSPHACGWFVKTLSLVNELVIHYAYCHDANSVERAMLGMFARLVSSSSRARLFDREHVMPFANLEFPPGVRKRHGIAGAKEPPRRSQDPQLQRLPRLRPPESAAVSREGSALTQRVTAGDRRAGIVRFPRVAKRLLPPSKVSLQVELRGMDLGDCLWDPRIGPDRERSGVLRIGKKATDALIQGERLRVERIGNGVRLM
jgi:hypothetical protein